MFIPFPSIELFHNVVRMTEAVPEMAKSIRYRGKIKLHGTNAAVQISATEIAAQSRTRIITPTSDNDGFARWVESKMDFWKNIQKELLPDETIVIFGEWCGPGIASGTAIQQIPTKIFAVFCILDGNSIETGSILSDSPSINLMLGTPCPSDIHVIPYEGEEVRVDYTNRSGLQAIADQLNAEVARVEPCDPWVKSQFGVSGIGEGIVYYPIEAYGQCSATTFTNYAFKAKGDKHKAVKTKEAVQLAPEVAKSLEDFVVMFITSVRMEQGLAAIGGSREMKNIPQFLKWVLADVEKESTDELAASGMTWSQVERSVQNAARSWFIAKSKELSIA